MNIVLFRHFPLEVPNSHLAHTHAHTSSLALSLLLFLVQIPNLLIHGLKRRIRQTHAMVNFRPNDQHRRGRQVEEAHQRAVLAPLIPYLIHEHEQHAQHDAETHPPVHDLGGGRELVDGDSHEDDGEDVQDEEEPRPVASGLLGIAPEHDALVQPSREALEAVGEVRRDVFGGEEGDPTRSESHSLESVRQGTYHDGEEQLKDGED
mmetsp:Transcript_3204/g.4805  ORF Transcript_3204/g.4805 Transcript_3204/m.4805 type:complete len:206 (+) Transcript_3204:169-786(+)